jgi:IclR family transcriptional regulator, pca regulon regulatory protein
VDDAAAEPTDAAGRGPYVQSLERGLAVIRAFDAEHTRMTLSEVARRTGLDRAAARRFLLTLVRLGYVQHDRDQFSLRPRVLELGFAYLSTLTLPEVAQPHMERLVAQVNESSSIAVLDDLDIVYAVRVPTRRIMSVSIAVGTRFPAWVTSLGRVLLAGLPAEDREERLRRIDLRPYTRRTITSLGRLREELDAVREQGWATVDQELEDGLRSIAAPIHDRADAVEAALNVSVHASRTTLDELRRRFVPLLLDTAAAIEGDLQATHRR